MAFLEMYLNGEWKNLSSFGTVSSVDVQSSSSAITVTGGPITSVGIINLSFNPSGIRLDQFAVPMAILSMNNYRITNVADPINPQDVATKAFVQASTPTISLTGAVTGTINNQGVINTLLSQYLALSQSYLNFDWTNNSSSSTYSLFNVLPIADLTPIFEIASQTGSSATNSQRKWNMRFYQGSVGTIENKFELSFYHSLLPGDHTLIPFSVAYSTSDSKCKISANAILDMVGNTIINAVINTPISNTDPTNKTYVDAKTWLSSSITDFSSAVTTTAKLINLNQFAIPTGNVNLNSNKIIGLATPTSNTDAASKGYVDAALGTLLLPITLQGDVTGSGTTNSSITTTLNKRLDQITAPTSSVSLNSQKIINLATPTLSTDGVNKSYIDSRTINDLTAPTSSFSMNSNKIINVTNPTSAQDVATKSYVDTSVTSSGILKSTKITRGDIATLDNLQVRVPSTGNLSLQVATVSGTATVAISRFYNFSGSLGAGSFSAVSLTSTFAYVASGDNIASDGGMYIYHIGDYTSQTSVKFYRVTIFNTLYSNNLIAVVLERLI
jgi:hypothetical protein